jgi:hypothetical protein
MHPPAIDGDRGNDADGQHLSTKLKVGSLTSPFSDEAPMMGLTPPDRVIYLPPEISRRSISSLNKSEPAAAS